MREDLYFSGQSLCSNWKCILLRWPLAIQHSLKYPDVFVHVLIGQCSALQNSCKSWTWSLLFFQKTFSLCPLCWRPCSISRVITFKWLRVLVFSRENFSEFMMNYETWTFLLCMKSFSYCSYISLHHCCLLFLFCLQTSQNFSVLQSVTIEYIYKHFNCALTHAQPVMWMEAH